MPKKEKPAQSGGISPRWISKLLQGSHDHYTCFLPRDIGSFSNLILKLFYSGIKLDNEQIEKLAATGKRCRCGVCNQIPE